MPVEPLSCLLAAEVLLGWGGPLIPIAAIPELLSTPMPRVIVLDTLAQEGLALFAAAPGLEYEVRTGLSGDALHEALSGADGAILRSGVKITAASLAGNRRLKAIVRAGVGTDNIDKTAATRLGIVVMNTPTGNTVSTAEHALAMILALSRNIAPAYQSLIEGRWDRNRYMGTQLANKTIGIIGLGRIGQTLASRVKALDMRVLGYDPFLSKDRAQELGIETFPTVHELLPHVDYLTVHTPLTAETKHLIGEKEIDMLKPGVRLINCARGGIYDEDALVAGLQSGKLGGVPRWMFSPASLARAARCSACRMSSARRTWARAPKKRRRRSRPKARRCSSTF